ncbi:uncharacterized protein LOC131334795 isoform X1 [Rhododendron vialii]|uniref:uncharacterized protein LOC131334795 isoform X1 n=2 Tax=Rhododendron vialii TaxID=182163 RepID=UPI00265F775C|nr:uncharacterized protein LOC131334795 isoform X1 [Rhododendron vialii]
MTSLLGFRRPQFSEEVAWLPAWLQQHDDGEPTDYEQHIIGLGGGGETTLELERGFTTGNTADLSSRDEGRYKSCHLFLSGEDNSPASFAPSSGNQVVNFHLHLSADGTSQNTPSSPLDTSQAGRIASHNYLTVQQTDVSACQEVMDYQFTMGYNVGGKHFPPFTSQQETLDHICPQSVSKDKDAKTNCEEDDGYHMVCDINNAVELSIAASEALVINDMLKSPSSTESLAAAAVLEVALRVKQARLQCLKDCFHFSTEDMDETDLLSGDDLHMADAYGDAGLTISNVDDRHACASVTSQVKDTPSSQNHNGGDDKYKHECHGPPNVVCDDIPGKQQSTYFLDMEKGEQDLPVEDTDFGRQRKWVDDLTSDSDASVVASHCDSLLHDPFLANSYVPATTEGVDFAIENMTSFPSQAKSNSSQQAWNYVNNETDDKLTPVGPDRFQSRWLGGWVWKKEINASVHVEHENAKTVSRFLVGETSYLSESADIAPDENSFMQKQDKGFRVDSQASIPFAGLHCRPDESTLFSLDVVRSPSLSAVDPLCSVVPCSISSENACSTLADKPNHDLDAEDCYRPESEYCIVNFQRTSGLNPECVGEEREIVSVVNGEDSQPTIRRQLNSLRSYSMLLPHCGAFVENDNTYRNRSFPSECISGFLSAEHNMGCKRDSTGLPSLKSMQKCSTARQIEENPEPLVVQNLVTDSMNQDRNCHETANNGTGLQVHMEKFRCSPLILNRGRRSRFQASKKFACDISGAENQKSVERKGDVGQHGKNLQEVEFKCKVACDTEVPPGKRVRFSSTEIQLLPKNNLQTLKLSNRGSVTRAGKRLRYSKPKCVSIAPELKRHQTNCLAKLAKGLIFRDIEFLLTGFSIQKEKELEGIIRKYGGIVLRDIPSPPNSRGKRISRFKFQQLPIVLCFRKQLETTKFLYGCAVNAYILNISWLTDSIAAGSALPPDKYMVIANHFGEKYTRLRRPVCCSNHNSIFDRVGVMLQGKHSFCTRLAKVVQHGGGLVFKTLQWLVQNLDASKISVGAIVTEDENRASRHLKYCASERKIPMMPASWIINSLHAGKLLPFLENKYYSPLPTINILDFPSSSALSEEI